MQKNVVIITLLALLISLLVSGADAVSWRSDLSGALDRARSSGDPVMVDFYTDWCHWCKKMDSDTYSDSRVNSLAKDFICVQVDAEKDKAVAQKYSVSGYPTVIFMNSAGNVMQVVTGYRRPDEFAATMEGVLKTARANSPASANKAAETPEAKMANMIQEPVTAKEPDNRIKIDETIHDLQRKLNKMNNGNMELEGILYDKACPRAVINDTIVKVGDTIEGAKVTKIEKKNVVLSLGNTIITLKLE